jgi:hypothetical protein
MDQESRVIALASIAGSFTKLAGAVLGLTAFLYVLGYLDAGAYFSSFRAPWMLGLLSAPQIMQRGALVMVIFFFGSISVVGKIFQSEARPRFITTGMMILAVIGIGLFYIAQAVPFLPLAVKTALLTISSISAALGAAFSIGEGVLQLSQEQVSTGWLATITLIFVLSILIAPAADGTAQALRHRPANLDSFAVVKLKDPDGQAWRILCAVGDKLALVGASNDGDVAFKVVEFSQVAQIAPTNRKD